MNKTKTYLTLIMGMHPLTMKPITEKKKKNPLNLTDRTLVKLVIMSTPGYEDTPKIL
jgi:hypothetical protein